jgi:hypothetical protein
MAKHTLEFLALTDFTTGKAMLLRRDLIMAVHPHVKDEGCTVVCTTVIANGTTVWYGVRESVDIIGKKMRPQ